ncbi:MAG: transglutaminase-like cysteine peptidase [Rhizobiaceae bacterium]|nr:transglutaminase-like cysteine peptidase [Rhizobiaceae bacterium]
MSLLLDAGADSHRVVIAHGASKRVSGIVSAILGLHANRGTGAEEAAPAAASFAAHGVRDSQLVARLRVPDQQAGRRGRQQTSLFRSVGIPFGKLPALARMAPIERDIEGGFSNNCATAACESTAQRLAAAAGEAGQKGFLELVAAVNSGVNNAVRYQPDRAIYGQVDFWASPSTTLDRGTGDCEDYAILKMAVLAGAGVPRSSMSIVVLRDQRRNVYHSVLSIRTTQGNFILDNVRAEVLLDAELPDYLPLYSITKDRGQIYGRPVGETGAFASLAGLDSIAPGEGEELPVDLAAASSMPR